MRSRGWCAATVREQLRPGAAGSKLRHTLEFDGWDEEWYAESLDLGRWSSLFGGRRAALAAARAEEG